MSRLIGTHGLQRFLWTLPIWLGHWRPMDLESFAARTHKQILIMRNTAVPTNLLMISSLLFLSTWVIPSHTKWSGFSVLQHWLFAFFPCYSSFRVLINDWADSFDTIKTCYSTGTRCWWSKSSASKADWAAFRGQGQEDNVPSWQEDDSETGWCREREAGHFTWGLELSHPVGKRNLAKASASYLLQLPGSKFCFLSITPCLKINEIVNLCLWQVFSNTDIAVSLGSMWWTIRTMKAGTSVRLWWMCKRLTFKTNLWFLECNCVNEILLLFGCDLVNLTTTHVWDRCSPKALPDDEDETVMEDAGPCVILREDQMRQ